jgi:integrase/ribosomal protein L37E
MKAASSPKRSKAGATLQAPAAPPRLTGNPLSIDNPLIANAIRGMVMTGTIRCSKCDAAFDAEKGTCSKCGWIRGYLIIYWKGKHFKIRRGKDDQPMGYFQCLDALLAINREMREGSFNPLDWLAANVQARKIRNVIDSWLKQKEAEMNAGELSPGTLKDYRGYIKHYFKPLLGDLDAREIRYEHLNRFRNNLPSSLKLKTRRNVMNALHAAFNFFWREEIIKEVPPFPIILGDDATPRTALTFEEQQAGLAKIPVQHRDILDFGMETGRRPGEICALKVYDILAASHKLRIRRTIYDGRERETTKGRRKSVIVLSDHAWEIIVRNIRGRELTDYIFINPETGRRYSPWKLNQLWRTYSGTDCCFYEAGRHSFCSQIAENEQNVLILQHLMDHADTRTTSKYCHTRDEKAREVVNNRGKVVPVSFRRKKENE